MKADMKRFLTEAFEAPAPKQKNEFLKRMERPHISIFSFMLQQVLYIRKRVWLISLLASVFAFLSIGYIGADSLWIISALLPFVALCAVTENTRSAVYGMAELEMTSRFSLKSITLARLSVIGVLHFLIFCMLVLLTGKSTALPIFRASIYLLVPYLLTSVLSLTAARKIHGKEVLYACTGISILVSSLNFVVKEMLPNVYGEKQFVWWCVLVIYLLVRMLNEYKRTIYQTEELVWN